MPPIAIMDYEEDGDGGWIVHWRDQSNLDGGPVEGFFEITPAKVSELIVVRGHYNSPATKMNDSLVNVINDRETVRNNTTPGLSQKEILGVPANVVPFVIRDFIDGYGVHIKDCIDKVKLGVHGGAPHEVLQNVRNGGAVPDGWGRRRNPVKGRADKTAENFIRGKSESAGTPS